MSHRIITQAVHNNAVWCDTVCRVHGWPGEFHPEIWLNWRGSLPYYPNAVTLTGATDLSIQSQQLHRLAEAGIPGSWGVKDSFCTLDLTPMGFQLLFDATWIYRRATQALPVDHSSLLPWQRVQTTEELAAWEAAWRSSSGDDPQAPRLFLPALLRNQAVVFLAAYQGQDIVAGAILNYAAGVVGVSNTFCPAAQMSEWWVRCVAAAHTLFPGRALVGYEHGQELDYAQAVGFAEIGPLRIWVRT